MSSGGGSASTPKLLDDDMKSKQFLQVLDIITEGPAFGPVDQQYLSSFEVNKTPVTSASGVVNINGISAAWRPGTADQQPISGFSSLKSSQIVNLAVTYDTPLVRTVNDPDVDRVMLAVGVSSLVETDSKGNQKKTSVTLVIETRTGNTGFQIQKTVTIGPGKISGEYLEGHLIDAPASKPFDIRVRRITADSTTDLLQNGTVWNSYTEITDDNLSYPYTSVAGAVIDRDQYTDTPTRNYHWRGLIVSVPDNYNPTARTYTGIWTGGFKFAWTDNPAWLFRELVTNNRFGLSRSAGPVGVDDGSLYVLSQYCDQLVNDGYGGKEPRMRLNAYITEQTSARDILDNIAGMFRGMAVWDGLTYSVMIDAPADPVAAITNANVVDGNFTYSSMPRTERYNAVVASWTDPNNGWSKVKEYVSDDAMILRDGYNETTIEAFGSIYRGQTWRAGKWIIETAKRESKKVTFQMARDAIGFIAGDIVEVMDNRHAGSRLGGRMISSSGREITVDADISELAAGGDTVSLMGADGKFVRHEISAVSGRVITLKAAPSYARNGTVFVISTSKVASRLFRIMSVKEDENNSTYTITANFHDPNKQAVVDDGAVFEIPSDTANGYRVPNIENLRIINTNSETVQVTATWETATTTRKLVFELVVYTEDGKVVAQYETDQFRYEFYGLDAGAYILGVRGRNDNGMKGAETQVSLVIGAPSAPSYVQWTPGLFSADIVPVMQHTATTDTSFEFWYTGETPASSAGAIEDVAQFLGRSSQWTLHSLKADTIYYMYVRTKNAFGVSDFVEASGQASADIPGMIDYIDDAVRNSGAFDNLQQGVDTNIEAAIQNALNIGATIDHQWDQYGEVCADILTVRTTIADVDHALAELSDQVQAQYDDVTAAVNQKLTAEVKADGTASAFYTLNLGIVRNDVKYNTGFAMGIEPDGSGSYKSTTVFAADQFGIYSGSDPGNYQAAFFVLNGQVFINSAFIQNGSIDNAKIGNYIQSNDYVTGKSGWQINKNGTIEIVGSSGTGRMIIANSLIQIYDNNNILRVRMGLW